MVGPRLDTSLWNLGAAGAVPAVLPALLLAGCGPIIAVGDTDSGTESATISASDTDPDTDSGPNTLTSPSTTSPSTTSPSTTSPNQCMFDTDCPPNYRCDNGTCYYNGYCDDDYCCYDECCGAECGWYNECYYSFDCQPGYMCQYNQCYSLTPEVVCESVPFGIGFDIPAPSGVVSLAFIESDGNAERELLIGGSGLTLARIDGTSTVIEPNSFAYDLDVRDLDGDGDHDVVMADGNSATPRVVLNDGMWTSFELPAAGFIDSIASVDLAGDGYPDILGISAGEGIYLWENFGPGSWGEPQYLWDPSNSVAVGALDGDAFEDFVASGYWMYALYGGPALQATELYNGSAAGNYRRVLIGNFNGGGDLDVIATESANGGTVVTSWPGPVLQGSGWLSTWWSNQVESSLVADMNLDGYSDVVGGGFGLAIGYGGDQGADMLQCVSSVATPISPYIVAAGDMSGDGRPDLAISDGAALHVMLRTD